MLYKSFEKDLEIKGRLEVSRSTKYYQWVCNISLINSKPLSTLSLCSRGNKLSCPYHRNVLNNSLANALFPFQHVKLDFGLLPCVESIVFYLPQITRPNTFNPSLQNLSSLEENFKFNPPKNGLHHNLIFLWIQKPREVGLEFPHHSSPTLHDVPPDSKSLWKHLTFNHGQVKI